MENNNKKFNQKAYIQQYQKDNYKQITFRTKPEKADYIKTFATSRNMTLSAAIIAALQYIDDNNIDITPLDF